MQQQQQQQQLLLLKLPTLITSLLLLLLSTDAKVQLYDAKGTDPSAQHYACDQKNASLLAYPFCNTSLPIDERVKDFVGRLTLEEKIYQLSTTSLETIGVPRLGVPPVVWWNEALHGVSWSPGVVFGGLFPAATSFPMPNTIAATFNSSLFFLIGQVVSTEARAMHNDGRAGLTFWSPNVNIFRDPRWGRGQETPGEDPLLSGTYAAEYVKGLQNISSFNERLKVSACCKHITAYDIENSTGAIRFDFDALLTEQDLEDTYNAPFQMCVEEGRASCLMCSYNRVNGVPNCANRKLLQDTIRESWHFDGYITTDTDSVQTYYVYTNYASTEAEAVADALEAGVDLNSGSYLRNYTMDAIRQNLTSESKVDEALSHTTRVLMRVGYFDGDPRNLTYGTIGPDQVCSEEHKKLALEASRQGIVLLKNLGRTLPLSPPETKSVALIGPHGNGTLVLTGNYAGVPCRYTTILQGLLKYTEVVYAPGCPDVECKSKSLFDEATDAASKADAVVLVMGLDLTQEAEGLDRTSLLLPGHQQELVKEVTKAAKGPVVLVILSGSSVDVSFAVSDIRVGGIIWAGYPGEDGGQALAEVIFGDYNPGGRLPTTWYFESYMKINISNMHMRPDPSTGYPGRTYRFFTDPTLFDFGYGLSYTKVTEKFYQVPGLLTVPSSAAVSRICTSDPDDCFHVDATDAETCNGLKTDITVEVHNEGSMPLSHALLLYTVPPNAGFSGAPRRQLAAFKRVFIEQDSSVKVEFHMNPCKDFSYAAADGSRILPGGRHKLVVGAEEHTVRVQAAVAVASA